jgi:GAF domain-containing protein
MNLEELGIPYTQFGTQKEIELFWHISQSLVSKRYLEEILQLIVTMTAEVMGSKICSLMLLDERKNELRIAATQALSPEYRNKAPVKVGESISGRAVTEKKPVTVPDVTKDKRYGFPDVARKEGIVSMLSVPMRTGDKVIGVINCYTKELHAFTDIETKVLQAVANQAAVAIENTTLREENVAVKQALEERRVIDQAKALLMEKDGLRENDAFQLIQSTSRDKRISMAEVANAILLIYPLRKDGPAHP